jgi:hypothetical protein
MLAYEDYLVDSEDENLFDAVFNAKLARTAKRQKDYITNRRQNLRWGKYNTIMRHIYMENFGCKYLKEKGVANPSIRSTYYF